MSTPLVYREVLSRGRRTFELSDDRILIQARYPNVSSEITVMLATLRSKPNIVWMREVPFRLGLIMMFCSWLPLGVRYLTSGAMPSVDSLITSGSISFVGAVICLYCIRKIEFACFVNHAGIQVLDVGDAGPDRSTYHEFIDAILERITACQPGRNSEDDSESQANVDGTK